AGLQAVVDALTVERVDASRGVTDQGPVATGHVAHRTTHRQQGRSLGSELTGERELLAQLPGVVTHQRLHGDVGGTLGGGQRPRAEVDLPVAQREDPAIAGQRLAVLVAQLQVGRDPRVVGAVRGHVRATGDAVDGVAVPLTPEHLAERGAYAV